MRCLILITVFAASTFGQVSTPDCAVRGLVVAEKGQPVEGVILSAYRAQSEQGPKILENAGMGRTDATGHYCLHLSPAVRPEARNAPIYLLTWQLFDFSQKEPTKRCLPPTWYPGVADFSAAKSINPSSTAEANFKLNEVPTFTIKGEVKGLGSYQKLNSSAETPEHITVQNGILDFDPNKPTFTITGVTAGEHTFVASAYGEGKPLRAKLHLTVDHDIQNALLEFSSGVSVPIQINGKPIPSISEPRGGLDDLLYGLSAYRPFDPHDVGMIHGFNDLLPDSYKLRVPDVFGDPPFQCVESFSPGDVEMEGNHLKIEDKQYVRPISITTGTNCGKLKINFRARDASTPLVVLVPESLPFPIRLDKAGGDMHVSYYPWPLTPGVYLAYGFTTKQDDHQKIINQGNNLQIFRYEQPGVLSRYHPERVTVQAGKTAEVMLDVVEPAP